MVAGKLRDLPAVSGAGFVSYLAKDVEFHLRIQHVILFPHSEKGCCGRDNESHGRHCRHGAVYCGCWGNNLFDHNFGEGDILGDASDITACAIANAD